MPWVSMNFIWDLLAFFEWPATKGFRIGLAPGKLAGRGLVGMELALNRSNRGYGGHGFDFGHKTQ